MTMRVVVLKQDEGLNEGEEYFIDRIKALQMIQDGRATTPNLYDKIIKKKAEETALLKEEAKKKAAEKKKKEEAALSKKATSRKRAVKR